MHARGGARGPRTGHGDGEVGDPVGDRGGDGAAEGNDVPVQLRVKAHEQLHIEPRPVGTQTHGQLTSLAQCLRMSH